MKRSTKINSGLVSGAAVCQAAAFVPIEGVPVSVRAVLGVVSVLCALLAGTRIVDEEDGASSRAERRHRTGVGMIVLLVGFTLPACAGVQDQVEILPPHIEASADTRVILPAVISGVPVVADVACEVTVDEPVPLCGVCLAVASMEHCACWRGTDRVACP